MAGVAGFLFGRPVEQGQAFRSLDDLAGSWSDPGCVVGPAFFAAAWVGHGFPVRLSPML